MKLTTILSVLLGGIGSLTSYQGINNTEPTFILNKIIKADTSILTAYIEGTKNVYLNSIDSNQVVEDSWSCTETKTINISADLSDLDPNSMYLDIELPLGMELKMTPNSLVDNKLITGVDDSKFAKTTLGPNNHVPKCGALRYSISPNLKKINLDILVAVDNMLWDSKSKYAAFDDKALKITIGDKNSSDTKKIDNIIVTGGTYSPWYWNAVDSSVTLLNQETAFKHLYLFSNQARLFKEVEVVMENPYTKVTENGVEVKKYIDVSQITLDYGGKVEKVDNKIICRWENVVNSSLYINFRLRPDGSIFNVGEKVYINYLDTSITGILSNTKHNLSTKANFTSTIYSNEVSVISTGANSRNVYMSEKKTESLNLFGMYRIKNIGANSSPQRVLMEFPTEGIGVKTITLPVPKESGTYALDITFWDYKTKNEFKKTVSINKTAAGSHTSGYKLTTSYACQQAGVTGYNISDLYIKSIEYTVASFPGNYDSGSSVDSWGLGLSGKVFGNILDDASTSKTYESQFTLTDLNDSSVAPIKNTFTTSVSKTGNAEIRFSGLKTTDKDKKVITELASGEVFNFSGNIYCPNYPYNNAIFINSPVFYIKLPKQIQIKENETYFSYNKLGVASRISYEIVNKNNPKVATDGHLVYKIKLLNDNVLIGGYNENISTIGSLDFNFNFSVSKSLKTTSLDLNDVFWMEDEALKIGKTQDKWDVNDNGSKTDSLLTIGTKLINIVASTEWLDVDIFIGDSNGTNNKPITQPEDIIQYGFTFNNSNDGLVRLGKMIYFIPIPKKDMKYDEKVLGEDNSFEFNMRLAKEVEPITGFDILYSYDNITFFNNSSVDLNKVSLIKIVNNKDIEPGDSLDIYVDMVLDKDSWSKGSNINSWSIYGEQTYEKNGVESRFIHTLDKFNVELIFNPKIIENPQNISVCMGKSATLSVSIDTGIPIATGVWQYRESLLSNWSDLNDYSEILSLTHVDYSMNGYEYRYKLSNKGGTVYSDIAKLTVIDNSKPVISLKEIRQNDDYIIQIEVTDTGSGVSHIILPDGSRVNNSSHILKVEPNATYEFRAYDFEGNESVATIGILGEIKPQSFTSSLDVYIKSENTLSLSLSNNYISFENFSGTEDVEKREALEMSIKSSLPYDINAYLTGEITNADKSKTVDKRILNLKESSTTNYKEFSEINTKLNLSQGNSAGNNKIHKFDFRMNGGVAHKKDAYKTSIKFEIVQQ